MFISSSNEIGAFESGFAAKMLGLVPSGHYWRAVVALGSVGAAGAAFTRAQESWFAKLDPSVVSLCIRLNQTNRLLITHNMFSPSFLTGSLTCLGVSIRKENSHQMNSWSISEKIKLFWKIGLLTTKPPESGFRDSLQSIHNIGIDENRLQQPDVRLINLYTSFKNSSRN